MKREREKGGGVVSYALLTYFNTLLDCLTNLIFSCAFLILSASSSSISMDTRGETPSSIADGCFPDLELMASSLLLLCSCQIDVKKNKHNFSQNRSPCLNIKNERGRGEFLKY